MPGMILTGVLLLVYAAIWWKSGKTFQINQRQYLLFRLCAHVGHFVHLFGQSFEFSLDDGMVDVFLVPEVSVERSPAFSRRSGDVVHRCGIQPLPGKEFAGHLYKFLTRFADRHISFVSCMRP